MMKNKTLILIKENSIEIAEIYRDTPTSYRFAPECMEMIECSDLEAHAIWHIIDAAVDLFDK